MITQRLMIQNQNCWRWVYNVARSARRDMLARGFSYTRREAVEGAIDAVNEYLQ